MSDRPHPAGSRRSALLLTLAGCISVKTPEKPIEINLNVDHPPGGAGATAARRRAADRSESRAPSPARPRPAEAPLMRACLTRRWRCWRRGPAVAQDDGGRPARAAGVVGREVRRLSRRGRRLAPALRGAGRGGQHQAPRTYSDLAARRGVPAQDVGVAAACALLGRVAVGEAYMLPDGQWRRRGPSEAAPRPNYCG